MVCYAFEFTSLLILSLLQWSSLASAFVGRDGVGPGVGADRMQTSSYYHQRHWSWHLSSENTPSSHVITQHHPTDKNDILNKHSRLCLAPMMDYTTRHFRAMLRLISNNVLTCTEMVAADELVSSGRKNNDMTKQLLGQSAIIPEGPSVLQLGGNDPSQIYNAAEIYHEYYCQKSNTCEYTALNLNCGCPSRAVSGNKCFGAALMRDPAHVTKLTRAMRDGVEGMLPITVKCRVGLYDNYDDTPFSREAYDTISNEKEYEKLRQFVETIASDGIVTNFQIHARIAVLGGSFSPADNRKVPPLKYDYVYRLAEEFPELNFVLNGGIHSLVQAKEELDNSPSLSGVMMGRAIVADPWSFAMADEMLFGGDVVDKCHPQKLCSNRKELLEAYGRHADYEELHNEPAVIRRSIVTACAHLFAGERNAKEFRRELDEIAGRPERLEREAKAQVWSKSTGASTLASAFSESSTPKPPSAGGWDDAVGWDDIQAMDDNTRWDEGEPPLSELILEAAHRHFGDEILSRTRKESWDKKVWEEEEARKRMAKGGSLLSISDSSDDSGKKVSGGVVDGWLKNGLN